MRIRLATLADEQAVRACAEDAYERYIEAIGKEPAPMVADFRAQISAKIVHVLTDDGGDVVGFIVFFTREDHMFLENVAVRGTAAGKGLGKKLIEYCEAEARQAGLKKVQLYTNEKMTDNLSMYPHLGFREIDRRREDGFSRVYFEKDLGTAQ